MQYARETTPPKQWSSPLFIHLNYVLTWVWTGAFALIAVVGYIGDGPLHQPDNVWTNRIIQIGAIILALKFTAWYPDHASARAEPGARQTPSRRRLPISCDRWRRSSCQSGSSSSSSVPG